MIRIDHLVVAARSLEEGAAWVESRLGASTSPGGRHESMGTHNRLLSLGPGRYLEVIAIDPAAPAPARPRWFDLDAPRMQVRLARSPALIHWVVRSDDIEADIAAVAGAAPEILSLSRPGFRWRIGVPESGRLAQDGVSPTLIQWEGRHPSEVLPESGCRLEQLVLGHADAARTLETLSRAGLAAEEPLVAQPAGGGLVARIRTARGIAELAS